MIRYGAGWLVCVLAGVVLTRRSAIDDTVMVALGVIVLCLSGFLAFQVGRLSVPRPRKDVPPHQGLYRGRRQRDWY